ncbi:succinate dehydrogenase flavoprotein subunit [Leptolyngbya boryana NIES-2135]|jgi:succinate dehydrogenase / fumarate reductase flavoprotein subunit|uniref:Succinate dehydrogenase flavoprotein subunit n=1 Tax=Leptolyngbya boryana NIES-2135 TaxID=1973484 RepID=A0A1Z4JM73_LEPBY|nr:MULTISPECIES: succinate dehydrogenase/fumarate reductase flavoprotein subunit [Leptolyngbya]BAY57864.1 succinate dehydrogenase flavoprotein subunit [Leptolyngbya boryana NIES-2135]MBD2367309.1 succinate dehydrogenase/fumarate reductase flavoprotein subunit [Leptolyngbya sp. FACHB-161]MBD2373834.1 succinate dehydrogenase/fumarate reductase flavoprotein subunit [Leptolyngbya sp. FACHB-238]MBD2398367.1 succinate dehydrogenase/fumarate reductase flavoprotein subunit [Leptolyngbya sp. FACHB-239]
MIDHDVIIVGGGLAGSRAALEIVRTNPSLSIAVVAKTHPIRSHSVAAQGGMAASLKNVDDTDSWEAHAFDTVKGSDYLADQDAVAILTQEAPDVVIDLEHMGVLFSRLADGRIAQRAFGGHSHNRTCYAADKTGHAILHELICNLMKYGVKIYEEWYVMRLILEDGQAKGVVMYHLLSGHIEVVRAKAVMFATGGYGRVYNTTSNDYASTGDGLAMTAMAGLPLEDMEFVQFHPTGLYPVGVLISEAVRGEGAYLINSDGDRFMANYAPSRMELAPRDITSRAIVSEVRAGRGVKPDGSPGGPYVYLDLRHMGKEKIMSRVPFCWEEAHRLVGVDAVTEPMPVRPTVHYCMGGIPVNTDGRVRASADELVDGFFAAGETSCVSVHGANRLGSNSLLECVVYGRRTGASIAKFVQGRKAPDLNADHYITEAQAQIQGLFNQSGQYRIHEIRQAYQDCMTEHCGVFRTDEVMQAGLLQLRELQQKYSQIRLDDRGTSWNTELIEALELRSLFVVGEMILFSAINRKESRGSHFREDYQQRDDAAFLKHTLAYYSAAGIDINYLPVVINQFEPQERKY